MSQKARKAFADHVAPYDAAAGARAQEYDRVDPAKIYAALAPHWPAQGARVLDIGAGSGRDAAWFAQQGYRVVAVEPSAKLRNFIQEKADICGLPIDVRSGMLPELATLQNNDMFDLIIVTAVWQHVTPKSRKEAFFRIASRLNPGGIVFMMLREGPPPADRKMYSVSEKSIARLARGEGLQVMALGKPKTSDMLGRSAVRWTAFAARKQA